MAAKKPPLEIIRKEVWDADLPQDRKPIDTMPVEYVLVMHSNCDPCHDEQTCLARVKQLQQQHMDQNMSDIQWNFLIGGDGRVYEGRGWLTEPEKDLEYSHYADKSLDIALIGQKGAHVTPLMEETLNELINLGIEENYIIKGYDLVRYKDHVGFQG